MCDEALGFTEDCSGSELIQQEILKNRLSKTEVYNTFICFIHWCALSFYDFLRFIFYFMGTNVLPAICMCAMNKSGTCGNQKRGVGSVGTGVAAGCEL